ncbi:MAG TPA: ABC transporter substrate-binding protein [Rhizomicrobium sp.]|jgi:phospholipid transport system substrate-binding protein
MGKWGLLLGIALAAAGQFESSRAGAAASPVEQFVQQGADSGIAILKDKSLSDTDRKARLEAFLKSLLDFRRMAIFTLGAAASSASPDDVSAFVDAYTQFSVANYYSDLGGYGGQWIEVTNAVPRADNDFIVTAAIHDAATPNAPPSLISLRVLDEGNGKFAVVDASVQGVWFAVAQRDEYAAFLKQNGGNVTALTAKLRDKAANLRSGGTPPNMQGK